MSAREIIEQIKTLSLEEREAVTKFIQTLAPEHGGATSAPLSREERFQKAADKVFAEHSELLRRLAQ